MEYTQKTNPENRQDYLQKRLIELIDQQNTWLHAIAVNIESLDEKTLTKREEIAAMIAQGMYANSSIDWRHIPHDAVHEADALLAQLGEEEK